MLMAYSKRNIPNHLVLVLPSTFPNVDHFIPIVYVKYYPF